VHFWHLTFRIGTSKAVGPVSTFEFGAPIFPQLLYRELVGAIKSFDYTFRVVSIQERIRILSKQFYSYCLHRMEDFYGSSSLAQKVQGGLLCSIYSKIWTVNTA
jgi:hypothetical protein